MSRSESPPEPTPGGVAPAPPVGVPGPQGSRYGWFIGLVALLIIALITVNTVTTAPNGSSGLAVGARLPPFALPLAVGPLNGDANVASRAGEGAAGRVAACQLPPSPNILNVCSLAQQGPLVLALFVAGGGCPQVIDDLQHLVGAYPGVRFAAVAIRGDRGHLRRLVAAHHWSMPVGYDRDGAVANLLKVSSCPQVTFLRAGMVLEPTLLRRPAPALLRSRVAALASGSSPAAASSSSGTSPSS